MLVAVCGGSVWIGRSFFFPKTELTKDALDLVRSKGSSQAPVWIVEYSDYQCPSCRTAFYILEEALRSPSSKIYLQARFFPLLSHTYGLKSAIYAYAAAQQDKFWEFHTILFEKQPEWSQASIEQIDTLFENYAKEAGIDVKKLVASVEDPKTKEKVFEEGETARSLGISTTPTFFINGKMAAGLTAFKEELARVLDPQKSGAS